jgi:transcriptional regulator with XRE-family HTH domain
LFKKEAGEIFYRNFNRRLAEIRIEKGLTQAELAELIGVGLRDFQKWEAKSGISLWTLFRLTKVLNCSASDFFKEPKTQKQGRGRPRKND